SRARAARRSVVRCVVPPPACGAARVRAVVPSRAGARHRYLRSTECCRADDLACTATAARARGHGSRDVRTTRPARRSRALPFPADGGRAMTPDTLARFRTAYGEHRAAEGRGRLDSRRLPYITEGPHASAWRVRARTYETFIATIVMPRTRELRRALRILDAGAGNGWLCHRLTSLGHEAVALDLRWD